MHPLLELENITKSFDGSPVLTGVQLTVEQGEVLGLVGENGVGKSTLMGVIVGDEAPDGGEIRFMGGSYDVHNSREALHRGVTIIRQRPDLDPKLTVAQSVFRSFAGAADDPGLVERAKGLLEGLRIHLPADARIEELAPAVRNFVEIARICAENPRLIIMDEVAARFNPGEVAQLHRIIEALTAQGRSVIYISHRLDEVRAVSNRIAVLVGGRVSHVFNAADVSTDHIADAMLTKSYREQRSREGHVRDEVMLSVRDMNCPLLLKDVSFDVHRGEVLGFVGSRRSGAAQIAGMLIGEVGGTIGKLAFNGAEHTISSPAETTALGIAYFSDADDELGLAPDESIARSLLREGNRSEEDFRGEVAKLREIIQTVRQLDIKTRNIKNSIKTLSGGDQQKVAFRRSINGQHPLLILNNPCRGIDVGSRREIYNAVAEHTEAGNSVILLTNDTTELLDWCDRIAIVKYGEIQDIRPASELDHDDLVWAMSSRSM